MRLALADPRARGKEVVIPSGADSADLAAIAKQARWPIEISSQGHLEQPASPTCTLCRPLSLPTVPLWSIMS